MGSAGAIAQVTDIVARYRHEQPVLVVSAMQGVTDALLALANDVQIAALAGRHQEVIDALDIDCDLASLFAELAAAARRERSLRTQDLIVSFGERFSAQLVAAALQGAGIDAVAVDARELIETDDHFTSATVAFAPTNAKITAALAPIIERGAIPVVTGFIGATANGETTTLGRGGSDYSVSIVAAALGAREIWIWKEVDGIMTADPRVVSEAALLSEISYDEAAEMSYFGAKVLHPKTMIPAVAACIPIRMRNTFRPDAPGTVIGVRAMPSEFGVKVTTAIKKLSMVTVEGKGMIGMAGFAARVLAVAGKLRVNIVMFSQSSSEQNICLVVESEGGRAFKVALEQELSEEVGMQIIDRIAVEEDVAAVAVVGEGMRGKHGVAARLFSAVADAHANVLAIAQGSSERNISFVVLGADADRVVRAVHAAFRLHELSAEIAVPDVRDWLPAGCLSPRQTPPPYKKI